MIKFFYTIVLFVLITSFFAQETEEKDTEIPDYSEDFTLTNLNVNSYDSDFAASYFKENQIIFSSTRKDSDNRNKKWKGNEQRFLNFYIAEINGEGQVLSYESLKGKGNTKVHESNAVFNKERSKVYFTRNTYYDNKKKLSRDRRLKLSLYIADVSKDGTWHNIVPFPYNSAEYSTGHPSLSLDGKKLYFVSDMPGGKGKTDIFMVEITESGTFTVPVNLGGNVNTPGREMFPFIAADGTLYFSSDNHNGLGKLDIFKTDSDELELAAIQNIGIPFNSSRDDFSLVLNDNLKEGYFSSNRTGGKGDDDIYYFRNNKWEEEEEEEVIVEVACNNIIKGTIIDAETGDLLEGAIVEILEKNKKTVFKEKVGKEATYSFEAPCNTSYTIKASKNLYKDMLQSVQTTDILGQEKIVDFNLIPEVRRSGDKLVIDIESIYFDYDSAEITPRAATELDKVILFMFKYPNVIIEGGSHTDCRGSDKYNMNLSQRRASSTVSYVIRNGKFDSSRIYATGYGETQPVNQCVDGVKCTEPEHSLNRRTEFVIVNPEVLE